MKYKKGKQMKSKVKKPRTSIRLHRVFFFRVSNIHARSLRAPISQIVLVPDKTKRPARGSFFRPLVQSAPRDPSSLPSSGRCWWPQTHLLPIQLLERQEAAVLSLLLAFPFLSAGALAASACCSAVAKM